MQTLFFKSSQARLICCVCLPHSLFRYGTAGLIQFVGW